MTEQILAVQRMQDYMEAHLTEEITLGDLARVSLFSPWYAHRLFRECTGLTPGEYLRRLRQSSEQTEDVVCVENAGRINNGAEGQ